MRHRLRVLEAIVMMAFARALIACFAFRRWRGLLGTMDTPDREEKPRLAHAPALAPASARALALAVERGAIRTGSKCLPQAMALQWMLSRRGSGSRLVLAVQHGAARGELDDLHAWLEYDGEVLIGGPIDGFHPLLAFKRTGGAPG